METLKEVINYLIGLADAGAAARIIFCIIKIMGNPDDQKVYERRIKNAVKFAVAANLIWVIKGLAEHYYL